MAKKVSAKTLSNMANVIERLAGCKEAERFVKRVVKKPKGKSTNA